MTHEEERAEFVRLDAEARRLRAEGDAKFRVGFRKGSELAKRRMKLIQLIYPAFALGLLVAVALFVGGFHRVALAVVFLLVGLPLSFVLRVFYLFWKYPQARQLAREEYERLTVREEVARQQQGQPKRDGDGRDERDSRD